MEARDSELREQAPARTICVDLDTFFVSVERVLDPSLRGRPVIVGGTPGKRGVVTAASYEVRKLGVHSGMPMAEAVRRAPGAVFIQTRHDVYSPYSRKVREILERIFPVVKPASIDEFYLDFSGCERLYHQAGDRTPDDTIQRMVAETRRTIQQEVGLPASAGIGSSRVIAKIASGLAKPAGQLFVPPGTERTFLAPLPVRKYPGIGPVAERQLYGEGIRTLGDLMSIPAGPVRTQFQALIDSVLRGARAQGEAPARPAFVEHDVGPHDAGSISNERTFKEDTDDEDRIRDQLRNLVERVCWRARKRNLVARTVTLKLRDADFTTVTRSKTIRATHAEKAVYACVLDLYRKSRDRFRPVRLLGVALSNLEVADQQLELPFEGQVRRDLGTAIDQVRNRFGYDAIRLGVPRGKTRWHE